MEDFEKSIQANNLKRKVGLINNFVDDEAEFEKAQPVGTVNKYGKMKMSDGTWKYAKKAPTSATPAAENSPNTKPATDESSMTEDQAAAKFGKWVDENAKALSKKSPKFIPHMNAALAGSGFKAVGGSKEGFKIVHEASGARVTGHKKASVLFSNVIARAKRVVSEATPASATKPITAEVVPHTVPSTAPRAMSKYSTYENDGRFHVRGLSGAGEPGSYGTMAEANAAAQKKNDAMAATTKPTTTPSKPDTEAKPATSKKEISRDDIRSIQSALGEEGYSSAGFDIGYSVGQRGGKTYVSVGANGKRGYPRDAEKKAMSSKPPLPAGYKYVTGDPVDYQGNKMTTQSLKDADERYDDRGYQSSEFFGEAHFEIAPK